MYHRSDATVPRPATSARVRPRPSGGGTPLWAVALPIATLLFLGLFALTASSARADTPQDGPAGTYLERVRVLPGVVTGLFR
ncbi:hypothetical protein GCM10027168_64450 [Streptomyces capparidis]